MYLSSRRRTKKGHTRRTYVIYVRGGTAERIPGNNATKVVSADPIRSCNIIYPRYKIIIIILLPDKGPLYNTRTDQYRSEEMSLAPADRNDERPNERREGWGGGAMTTKKNKGHLNSSERRIRRGGKSEIAKALTAVTRPVDEV